MCSTKDAFPTKLTPMFPLLGSINFLSIYKWKDSSRPMETDATRHNIVSPTMLGVVGTYCVAHGDERNNCQHCWWPSKEVMHSGASCIASFVN